MDEHRKIVCHNGDSRLTAMRTFLNFAANEDLTLVAVAQAAAGVKPPRTPHRPIEYLDTTQTGLCWVPST